MAERLPGDEVAFFGDPTPAAIAVFDRELRFVRANPAFSRLSGRPREEHVGRLIVEVAPWAAEQLAPVLRAAVEKGTVTRDIEIRAPGRAGVVLASVFPITGADDAVVEQVLFATEPHMQPRSSNAVRREHRLLFAVLDTLDALVTLLDRSGRVVLVNRACSRLTGFALSDLGTAHFSDAIVDARDRALAQSILERMWAGERSAHLDLRWRTPAGEPHIISCSLAILEADTAGPEYLLCTGIDVSEERRATRNLRESERMYRTLFETTPDAIAVFTKEGKVLAANAQVAALHGYASLDDFHRHVHSPNDIVAPADRERLQQLRDRVIELGSLRDVQMNLVRSDGSTFPAELNSSLVPGESGSPSTIISIMRDISERRLMDAELLRARNLESLSLLSGGIAHDFNNLLAAVLGHISLAGMEADDARRVRERLVAAERAVLRLRGLTQQLLTFSKGEAPVRSSASIGALLRESAEFALRGSNISCEYTIASDLWNVETNESQIVQVINNLVINAIQAMPIEGKLSLVAENIELDVQQPLPLPPGPYVRIRLADNGMGIAPEHLPRIFDPFFTTRPSGCGLGLATVHSIVTQHRGHIGVESRLGAGTTFSITLPAAHATKAPVVEPKRTQIASGTGRILLMDDDAFVREVTAHMLVLLGYKVVGATDGADAVDLYSGARQRGEPFDLAILDLTVRGGMGALRTATQILDMDPEARCVVASGYSTDPVLTDYARFGFCAALAKPFTPWELGELLRRLLPLKASEQVAPCLS